MPVKLHIQKPSQFDDEFTSIGELSISAAIEYFVQFPFEEELRSIEEREYNVTYPTLMYTTELGVTVRVQMQSLDEYLLEARKDNKVIERFFNADFDSNSKIATGKFLHEVLMNSSSLEWDTAVNEPIEEELERDELVKTFSYTAKISDFLVVADVLLYIGLMLFVFGLVFLNTGLLIMSVIFLFLPMRIHLKQWQFYKWAHGVTIKIDKADKSFYYKNKEGEKWIKREQIEKCTLIVDESRSSMWLELKIQLKNGNIIRISELLMNPYILISDLGLKYSVLK